MHHGSCEFLGEIGGQQKVVDSQSCIAGEGPAKIFPERIDALIGMKLSDGVRPTQPDEVRIGLTNFGTKESVVAPAFGGIDIKVGRDGVEVAGKNDGHL